MCRRSYSRNLRLVKSVNEILHNLSRRKDVFLQTSWREKIFGQNCLVPEETSICLGGFQGIGRSAMLIVTHESKVLLDFGIKSYKDEDTDILPRLDIYGIGMDEIDAVIISHAHLDA